MFNKQKKNALLLASAISVFSLPSLSHAQQTDDLSWWDQGKNKVSDILDNGQQSLLVSGYAHHGRGTYSAERIRELNEKSWGLGFTKSVRNSKDNEELVYALGISDSHYKPQLMAGYAYQWTKSLGGDWEIAGGYTAMLMSRQDYFSGIPFPIALPLASIGTRHTKLMAAYVPRLSKNKGNGDVLLMFMRFDIN
ncbi:hypothetical protein [Undibacterium sp.]|jgi:hypothetical protein|uniref:hypothetical protein n=1 Tax=Undibacterium sp. TaxID=1914977 RepID=UPI002BB7F718|nr:hypothetical protein [Undibacterium sp.]HTD05897.1 hypothetical protein [Undibacterium sp.]